jgi:hypothetical protein
MKINHCNVGRDYLLEFFSHLHFDYEIDSIANGLMVDILFVEQGVAVVVEPPKDDSIDWRIQQKHKGMTVKRIKRAEDVGYKVFYFQQKQLKGKKFKLSVQKIYKALMEPVIREATLGDDLSWQTLSCKKLGIDTAKPKCTPINA